MILWEILNTVEKNEESRKLQQMSWKSHWGNKIYKEYINKNKNTKNGKYNNYGKLLSGCIQY